MTEQKLTALGLRTVGDVRACSLAELQHLFGRYGQRLYELSRGIDETPVVPDRPVQSVSAEDTFEEDLLLSELEPMIRTLAEKSWGASLKTPRCARTVVLKLKTAEFRMITRSRTEEGPPSSHEDVARIALSLLKKVDTEPGQRFRLVGVGLSNFQRSPEDRETLLFPT